MPWNKCWESLRYLIVNKSALNFTHDNDTVQHVTILILQPELTLQQSHSLSNNDHSHSFSSLELLRYL